MVEREALVSTTTQGVVSGRPSVVVVGSGISGLATAHRLMELNPAVRVTVLESGPRPGGVLQTVRKDGFLIETSADSFITAVPWGLDLCRRVGLGDEIEQTAEQNRRAFVVTRGRLEPIPDGLMVMAPSRIMPMVTTRILSVAGKLRMGLEVFIPRGGDHDESMAAFVRRRFGREAYERLIQPLVGGIYTADPEYLSLQATMPRFLEMERTHGSLIRATLKNRKGVKNGRSSSGSGARYGLFVGLRRGVFSLVERLLERLPEGCVRCHSAVERLARTPDGRWLVKVVTDPTPIEADAVVLATPAHVMGALLRDVDEELSEALSGIASTSTAIVSLGYRREDIAHPLDGFGFVVPTIENRAILSGSFSSVKFPGRSPDGSALIRVFLGGAHHPEALERTDSELIATAHEELSQLLGIRGEPVVTLVSRWPQVMPQYQVGHLDRVALIESRTANLRGLALAGNPFRGVGVPYCIHTGETTAERIVKEMAEVSSPLA